MSLIECIPNVSEGRRTAVLDALAARITAIPHVRLLDRSADPSHNRSVFTFAGPPDAAADAALALAAGAIDAIDLRTHRGVHPRLGALDVVPFVPLADATLADCVLVARRVGQALAERWQLPVYLYEEAAIRPERRHLEDIRRGEFEGLAAKMKQPQWAPDFGPSAPHPTAGASAVGARRALIAFNVNLATDRLEIARRIARIVRQSGGGLPFVKALGLPLAHRGIVQVSMNLTNYERTPLQTVFDWVAAEAAHAGVAVLESELVGLLPRAALTGTTPERLHLRAFSAEQILETRLAKS